MSAGRHFYGEFRRSQTAATVRNDFFNGFYGADPLNVNAAGYVVLPFFVAAAPANHCGKEIWMR
jgi:hypothetical protein